MDQTMQGPVDQTTRCAKCGKRMVPIVTISGRTDLQCIIPILHQSELMMYGKDVMERTSPGLRSM